MRLRPHAVCVPLPLQGHINPLLKLAKLLHSAGFFITFVHSEYNYNKSIQSSDPSSMFDLEDFRFATIVDGLPPDHSRGILDLPALAYNVPVDFLKSFRELIERLNSSPVLPPVSCIVADGMMSFTLKVAQEFNIHEMLFFTASACALWAYLKFEELIEKGYFPLKDESYLNNGYLDTTTVDWTPSMKSIRLSDFPTFIRTTNGDDILFHYNLECMQAMIKTGSLILNTFEELEQEVLDALKEKFPNLYTIGPLYLLSQQLSDPKLDSIGSSLWRQDKKSLEWLDQQEPSSVIYVNYGSLVIMTPNQLSEFAWGLANSKYPFLWVIRPDLVNGGKQVISGEFLEEIKDRGIILEWCPQEEVLRHRSVGGFLTHCGWNSTLESISEGVPMICWPFFADQQINSLYLCSQWGLGMEIDTNVERGEVEGLVRELMEGKKGVEMREKALDFKSRADKAAKPGGSSYMEFGLLVQKLKSTIGTPFHMK